MAASRTGTAKSTTLSRKGKPRSLTLSEPGIRSAQDFANVMGALMTDLLAGRVAPNIGNAMCNAGGKMLKAVEMQLRYGKSGNGGAKVLMLSSTGTDG